MSSPLKKISIQVDSELINELKLIAKQGGKSLQSIVDEAFRDLLDKKKKEKPRKHVMDQFNQSLNKFASLYEKLAQ